MTAAAHGMTVGRKFLLIAIASLVPLAFSTALWLVEIGSRVESLERERAGLSAHLALRRVLGYLIDHREASVRAALGANTRAAAAEAAANARKALAEAEPPATRDGTDRDALKILGELKRNLDQALVGGENRAAEQAWLDHNEVLNDGLVPLMAHVASAAGLNVDNDPATYHLARIAMERLPALAVKFSEARTLGPILTKRGKGTSSQIDRLRAITVLAQADLEAIDALDKGLARADPQVTSRLQVTMQELDTTGNGFVRSLEPLALAARDNALGWEWVYESDQSVEKTLGAYDRVHRELSDLIGARLSDLAQRRNLLVFLNFAVIGVAALFAFFLMRSVRTAIARALSVADRVAGGDLTQVAKVQGTDETARLIQSLSAMTQGLARMVGEVRQVSETVGADVRSLAEGNRNLSERTESQATAIEQAAASMEEITASVRQNTDHAKETHRIADLAGQATTRGIEAATRVVDHMESLREGTRRVGEIVGLIDAIAFQTNILALNAAVEAARAGEHGRGFAVVATEVRNLAKRCAESAREIKGLVGTASGQVSDGARLVDEVAEAIGDINTRVVQVGELMNRIVSAGAEQSSGIGQVGQTISQMERVTQQNAALVEEIVAATESLSQQTARLGAFVGVFRLDAAQAAKPAATPATAPARAALSTPAAPRLARAKVVER